MISNNKRVAFFIPALSGGGAERVIINICEFLVSNNVDVTLIVNKNEGSLASSLPNNVRLEVLNKRNILFCFVELKKVLIKNSTDVLISTIRGANITVAFSRLFYSKYKWVLREANTFTNLKYKSPSLSDSVIQILCKFAYQKADQIIANSPDTLSDIENYCYGDFSNNSVVLPNPVYWKKNFIKPNYSQKRNNKIIAIGRLENQKNYFYLIDIINSVKDEVDLTVDIFGEGSLKEELLSYINDKGCQNVIEIKPFEKDIFNVIREYDCFVLTSKWEGFGNVLIESMANGLKIFVANCPGGPRYIDFGGLNYVEKFNLNDDMTVISNQLLALIRKEKNINDFNEIIERSSSYTVEIVGKAYAKEIFDEKR